MRSTECTSSVEFGCNDVEQFNAIGKLEIKMHHLQSNAYRQAVQSVQRFLCNFM